MTYDKRSHKRPRIELIRVVEDDSESSFDSQDDLISMNSNFDDFDKDETEALTSEVPTTIIEHRAPPRAFICPLTQSIMFDPVLDTDGNSFERQALVDYVRAHGRSPFKITVPLDETMLVPNKALRRSIHELMGPEWVARKIVESKSVPGQKSSQDPRSKMNALLQVVSKSLGTSLKLNDEGCCAFAFGGLKFQIEVPEESGNFAIYTKHPVEGPVSDQFKARLLDLHRIARGGSLSLQDNNEIFFSYMDRVNSVSAADVQNIIRNFVSTTLKIKNELERHVIPDVCTSITV